MVHLCGVSRLHTSPKGAISWSLTLYLLKPFVKNSLYNLFLVPSMDQNPNLSSDCLHLQLNKVSPFIFFLTMPLLTSASRRLQIHRRGFSSSKFQARALGSDSGRQLDVTRELIVLNSALTLILGVANRVLYKLALVPMKEYPFFSSSGYYVWLTPGTWLIIYPYCM